MLQLNILQDQWLLFALVGGFALVLALVLAYLAMWRPRDSLGAQAGAEAQAAAAGGRRHYMPWFLIVTFVFILGFMIVYVARAAMSAPNW